MKQLALERCSPGCCSYYDHRLSKHLPLPESSVVQEHLMGLLLLLTSKSLWQREGSGPKANVFSKVTASHKKTLTLLVMAV